MTELLNFVRFTVNTNTEFESKMIELIIRAYREGSSIKGQQEYLVVDERDVDYVDIEGTEKSREIFKELVKALNCELTYHDMYNGKQYVKEYCKKHNLEYIE